MILTDHYLEMPAVYGKQFAFCLGHVRKTREIALD